MNQFKSVVILDRQIKKDPSSKKEVVCIFGVVSSGDGAWPYPKNKEGVPSILFGVGEGFAYLADQDGVKTILPSPSEGWWECALLSWKRVMGRM